MSDKPLTQNAADEQQVEKAGKREQSVRDRELNDVRIVLSTPAGRRFVWRYLERCGLFRTSFTGNEGSTFFNEGERNIGIKLLADVNEADPERYLLMMKESKGDKDV